MSGPDEFDGNVSLEKEEVVVFKSRNLYIQYCRNTKKKKRKNIFSNYRGAILCHAWQTIYVVMISVRAVTIIYELLTDSALTKQFHGSIVVRPNKKTAVRVTRYL